MKVPFGSIKTLHFGVSFVEGTHVGLASKETNLFGGSLIFRRTRLWKVSLHVSSWFREMTWLAYSCEKT